MLYDGEVAAINADLEAKMSDIIDFGVANVGQYPNIVKYWSEEHGEDWLSAVMEKGDMLPTTQGEQLLSGVIKRVSGSANYTREALGKVGYAMSVNQVGACTHFAMATAHRILSLQEEGKFPSNFAVRVMSGKHTHDTGIHESHLCVVLDKLPADEEYLKSNQLQENNSIVVDSWYAAQGGPLCFTPSEFTDSVGNYMEIEEGEGVVEVHYCSGTRNPSKLEKDKAVVKEAIDVLKNQFNSINSLASTSESNSEELTSDELVLEEFVSEHSELIKNFNKDNEEKVKLLGKSFNLNEDFIIVACKYDYSQKRLSLQVKEKDNYNDKGKWLGNEEIIGLINGQDVKLTDKSEQQVSLEEPKLNLEFETIFPYGKDIIRENNPVKYNSELSENYKGMEGDLLQRAILNDFKQMMEVCPTTAELLDLLDYLKDTPEFNLLKTPIESPTGTIEVSAYQAYEKMASDAKTQLDMEHDDNMSVDEDDIKTLPLAGR
jgi:hypothetical protein